jgi:hypothetical protein
VATCEERVGAARPGTPVARPSVRCPGSAGEGARRDGRRRPGRGTGARDARPARGHVVPACRSQHLGDALRAREVGDGGLPAVAAAERWAADGITANALMPGNVGDTALARHLAPNSWPALPRKPGRRCTGPDVGGRRPGRPVPGRETRVGATGGRGAWPVASGPRTLQLRRGSGCPLDADPHEGATCREMTPFLRCPGPVACPIGANPGGGRHRLIARAGQCDGALTGLRSAEHQPPRDATVRGRRIRRPR